jgi:hypothetical protein
MPETEEQLSAAGADAQDQSATSTASGATSGCPSAPSGVLELALIDELDRPVADVVVRLLKSDTEAVSATTSRAGVCRFAGLPETELRLTLPALDEEAWNVEEDEALEETEKATLSWTAPEDEEAEATTHAIERGECLVTLAELYGFRPADIWDDAHNEDLRADRPNPYCLVARDEVYIPARTAREVAVTAGKRYKARRYGLPPLFRFRFLAPDDEPRADEPYLVEFEGEDVVAPAVEGTTNEAGALIVPIPAGARSITITLRPDDEEPEVVEALVGTLPPVSTLAGIKARLTALFYDCGEPGDEPNQETTDSIGLYQMRHELDPTGEPDEDFRAALTEEFGS